MQPPQKLILHRKSQTLEVVFEEASYNLRAEYLRVFSPSAEVKGHGPGQEVLQLNKQDVCIEKILPQGNYAIRLVFSDGHDSGIFSWNYLSELGQKEQENWQDYLNKVEIHEQEEEERKAGEHVSAIKWIDPQSPNTK